MEPALTIRGRRIGTVELQEVRQLIGREGQRGRSYLSRQLCALWDWRQPNGRFREIACRELLRRLEAKGLVQLPARLHEARRAGYQNPVVLPQGLDRRPLRDPLRKLAPGLVLELVQEPAPLQVFKGLVGTYHYLGYQQATGAQLKYLAYYQERPLAALSFGPAAFHLAPRDQFIGWSAAQRQARLHQVVNQDRFLILPWVQVPCLASWLLSRCLRRLARDWQQVYQHPVVLCETFVERTRFPGVAYAAANWICVGQTRGRGRNDQRKQARLPLKTVWLYPLRADFRPRLCAPQP